MKLLIKMCREGRCFKAELASQLSVKEQEIARLNTNTKFQKKSTSGDEVIVQIVPRSCSFMRQREHYINQTEIHATNLISRLEDYQNNNCVPSMIVLSPYPYWEEQKKLSLHVPSIFARGFLMPLHYFFSNTGPSIFCLQRTPRMQDNGTLKATPPTRFMR